LIADIDGDKFISHSRNEAIFSDCIDGGALSLHCETRDIRPSYCTEWNVDGRTALTLYCESQSATAGQSTHTLYDIAPPRHSLPRQAPPCADTCLLLYTHRGGGGNIRGRRISGASQSITLHRHRSLDGHSFRWIDWCKKQFRCDRVSATYCTMRLVLETSHFAT